MINYQHDMFFSAPADDKHKSLQALGSFAGQAILGCVCIFRDEVAKLYEAGINEPKARRQAEEFSLRLRHMSSDQSPFKALEDELAAIGKGIDTGMFDSIVNGDTKRNLTKKAKRLARETLIEKPVRADDYVVAPTYAELGIAENGWERQSTSVLKEHELKSRAEVLAVLKGLPKRQPKTEITIRVDGVVEYLQVEFEEGQQTISTYVDGVDGKPHMTDSCVREFKARNGESREAFEQRICNLLRKTHSFKATSTSVYGG